MKETRGFRGMQMRSELGWFSRDEVTFGADDDNGDTIGFCECETDAKTKAFKCYRITDEGGRWDDDSDSEEAELQRDELHSNLCHDRVVFNATLVAAKDVLRHLTSDQDEDREFSDNILLDIDEDYFGVELPWQKLTDLHTSTPYIHLLDAELRKLICAKTGSEETLGNIIMKVLIEQYFKLCYFPSKPSQKTCNMEVRTVATGIYENYIRLAHNIHPRLFCAGSYMQLLVDLHGLVKALNRLEHAQIEAILRLGFCFNESPKSYRFDSDESSGFIVCHGSNEPSQSYTPSFKPTDELYKASKNELQSLLDALPPPKVVTIARSVRDGYTPRQLAPVIELDILSHLTSQEERLGDWRRTFNVTFDPDLLILPNVD